MSIQSIIVMSAALLAVSHGFVARPQRPLTRPQFPSGPISTPPFNPNARTPDFLNRGRRDVNGVITSNPQGGADVLLKASEGIGNPNVNAIGTLLASGNTQNGPVTTGSRLDLNYHDLNTYASRMNKPGFGQTDTLGAAVNILKTDENRLDLNAFKSATKLDFGPVIDRTGGSVDWSNIRGHGASAGFSDSALLGKTLDLSGRANLWRSQDAATTLDATAFASKNYGGIFPSRTNWGFGTGLTHRF